MDKRLGKITSVSFGIGGYQDAMLGIFIFFESDGWCMGTDKCAWDCNLIPCSEHAKWTESDRSKQYDEIMRFISGILSKAKVKSVDQLKGIPVEIETENMTLKSWRVLTEVL